VELLNRPHRHIIGELATKLHKPEEEVERVFVEEFERLEKQATIKTYLPLLAQRIVTRRLGVSQSRWPLSEIS
jgi:hypothetical protein